MAITILRTPPYLGFCAAGVAAAVGVGPTRGVSAGATVGVGLIAITGVAVGWVTAGLGVAGVGAGAGTGAAGAQAVASNRARRATDITFPSRLAFNMFTTTSHNTVE
ncbi:MAG: hypothetical protein Q8O76_05590 [Chloroflexota bacterium]|nr:hypothetical protein [Chloroflexota bacterium]